MTAPGQPALVRIRDLSFAYPGTDSDVLRIPALDITGRGLVALTGPSGVGKSTLVELLAGTLREPYDGSLQVLGEEWRDLTGDADRQRHLRRIGLIPQDYGLLTNRTPRQTLEQDLADAQIPSDQRDQRIAEALAQVDIADLADRQIRQLSGGQRQRVAIARLLARDVELVIADEPTANLDRELTGQTLAVLRELADKVPVLVVTHEAEVAEACDRTIVLQALAAPAAPQAVPAPRRVRRSRRFAGGVAVVAAVAAAAGYGAVSRNDRPTPAASQLPGATPTPTAPSSPGPTASVLAPAPLNGSASTSAATAAEIVEPNVFVTMPMTIGSAGLAAIAQLPNVIDLVGVTSGTMKVSADGLLAERVVHTLGVDPGQFRRFTPELTAKSDPLWQAMDRGDLVADYGAGLSPSDLGEEVHVTGGSGDQDVRFGALAAIGVPHAGALVTERLAEQLGFLPMNAIVVAANPGAISAVVSDVQTILGPEATVETFGPPGDRR